MLDGCDKIDGDAALWFSSRERRGQRHEDEGKGQGFSIHHLRFREPSTVAVILRDSELENEPDAIRTQPRPLELLIRTLFFVEIVIRGCLLAISF